MPFVDWLQYTVKEHYKTGKEPELLQSFYHSLPLELQLNMVNTDGEFMSRRYISGQNGYRAGIEFENGVCVYYDGKVENGYNVKITGSVLADNELTPVCVKDWLINIIDKKNYVLSRVDIAYDTDIDFAYFVGKYERKEYICRYRSKSIFGILDADKKGTLYWGKCAVKGQRQKATMFRIYDKKYERQNKLKGPALAEFNENFLGQHWTRIEGQFMDYAAKKALIAYANEEVGEYFLGHLRFVKERRANMSRDCENDEIYTNVVKADFGRKISKEQNVDLPITWMEDNVAQYAAQWLKSDPESFWTAVANVAIGERCRQKFDDEIGLAILRRSVMSKAREKGDQIEVRRVAGLKPCEQVRIPGL